jgi:hypothetical protein
MAGDKDKHVIELHTNEALPALFVDNLAIMTRADGMFFLRFFSALPEGLKEQSRMMVPRDSLTQMIDVLCRHCDHFPVKAGAKTKAK